MQKNEISKLPGRVVLLGGSGFIGSVLAQKLENKGHPYLSFSSSEIDLINEDSVAKLESILTPNDTVVVLSALTPDRGKGVDTFRKNIVMAENITKAIKKTGVSHVVYFSSDAVYPMDESVVDEKTKPSPEDLYGMMHLSREEIFKSTELPLTILRPTLIYGYGDTHNSYGPNRFIRQAVDNGEISLFGNGEEKRSHISVEHICDIVCRVIEAKFLGILNLATEPSVSFMEVAKLISSNIHSSVKIQTSKRQNPITYRHFNTSLLSKTFPEIIPIGLLDGLLEILKIEKEIHETNRTA